ncbi:YbaK/EbsC family protein [Amycolatopsis benzoatilytica]|uniref:YbaK/EbsC family protein n=1 Tax=Amycolatopsis benzoatilytica TaxID=346045 RepID=UPI00036D4692|nr:YbaK/EbsC family protein [Amycolatopsis benzoatilytica]
MSATQNVQNALETAGAAGQARTLPQSTRTAAEAADALGCEVGAIANSLVFMADGQPLLVLTSGAHRVDVEALAARLGRERIRRAKPDEVRAATGQVIGGVSPVGHPAPVETVVDEALRRYPQLWAAAGTPNSVFPTSFDELVRITEGAVVRVN